MVEHILEEGCCVRADVEKPEVVSPGDTMVVVEVQLHPQGELLPVRSGLGALGTGSWTIEPEVETGFTVSILPPLLRFGSLFRVNVHATLSVTPQESNGSSIGAISRIGSVRLASLDVDGAPGAVTELVEESLHIIHGRDIHSNLHIKVNVSSNQRGSLNNITFDHFVQIVFRKKIVNDIL